MTEPPRTQSLGFFTTPPHECGYLPNRRAVTLFVDPRIRPDRTTYSILSQHGFRRSGGHVYRPKCPSCEACIPIRLAVEHFKPRRSQRRNLRKNAEIVVRPRDPVFDPNHFELYRRYISARHSGGGMENPDPDTYMDFLTANWATTTFYEFHLASKLVAVAVTDRLDDGLSAVYTFFDPTLNMLGLGQYAILREIELTKSLGLKWLYLGYWIEECRKMSYKTEFSPHQCFVNGAWREQTD